MSSATAGSPTIGDGAEHASAELAQASGAANDEAEFARQLAQGVGQANIPTLLMVLVQLTGDLRWIEAPYTVRRVQGSDENDTGQLGDAAIDEVRRAAEEAILNWRRTGEVTLPRPDDALLIRMMSSAMGEEIGPEQAPMIAADLDLVTRGAVCAEPQQVTPPPGFHVAVIGAGAGGIAAAIRLQAANIPFTIYEREDGVGGVWWANRYPGAGVDIPNHLYSYSFANYDFSRYFVLQGELRDYMQEVVRRYDLAPHLRLSSNVKSARYDEARQVWDLEVEGPEGPSTVSANFVIAGSGLFNPPKWPAIEGLEGFSGVAVHTADWDDSLDLTGKRVAVIGSGASAMQVAPAIASQVARLTVFQRSPTWAAPFAKFQMEIPAGHRFLFREVPIYRAWYRLRLNFLWSDRLLASFRKDPAWPHPERSMNAINDAHRRFYTNYIRSEVGDRPELMAKLVPAYPPYAKRILFDNGWYRMMTRENVELVTEPILSIEPKGVVTTAGELHEQDVIIFATGFDVQKFLSTFEITGRGGANIRDVWGDDEARAYLGTAVPGFPNFFCLYGPNTQSGSGGSIIALLEAQANYALSAITQALEQGFGVIECRQDVHDAYNRKLDERLKDTVWAHPGASTYFRNAKGRITVNSGLRKVDFWTMTRRADLSEYRTEQARVGAVG